MNISPEQTGYITNAPAGCGLLRYGGALVPFKNQFPKDTELYRLMTTKPDESIIVEVIRNERCTETSWRILKQKSRFGARSRPLTVLPLSLNASNLLPSAPRTLRYR